MSMRLVSTIKWHNVMEELPKDNGEYLCLVNNAIIHQLEFSKFPVLSFVYVFRYEPSIKAFNVHKDDDGEWDLSTQMDVTWWATMDDINEVYIKEADNE